MLSWPAIAMVWEYGVGNQFAARSRRDALMHPDLVIFQAWEEASVLLMSHRLAPAPCDRVTNEINPRPLRFPLTTLL